MGKIAIVTSFFLSADSAADSQIALKRFGTSPAPYLRVNLRLGLQELLSASRVMRKA